jgi:hypothetical protein
MKTADLESLIARWRNKAESIRQKYEHAENRVFQTASFDQCAQDLENLLASDAGKEMDGKCHHGVAFDLQCYDCRRFTFNDTTKNT